MSTRFWLAALLFFTMASAASADDPVAFIRPGDSMPFAACVYPVPYWEIWIDWSVELVEYGGHNHTLQGRPQAWLEPSDGGWTDVYGCAYGTFHSDNEQYAGAWKVHAVAYGWPGLDANMNIAVGVFDPVLETLPPTSWYQLDPPYQPAHPWSHSGTFSTVVKIQDITWQFFNETGQAACVNDMSVLWGGAFDIGPPYGQFWNPPHSMHRWGQNADIPWRSGCFASVAQRNRFAAIAGGAPFRCVAEPHPAGNPTHWHLNCP